MPAEAVEGESLVAGILALVWSLIPVCWAGRLFHSSCSWQDPWIKSVDWTSLNITVWKHQQIHRAGHGERPGNITNTMWEDGDEYDACDNQGDAELEEELRSLTQQLKDKVDVSGRQHVNRRKTQHPNRQQRQKKKKKQHSLEHLHKRVSDLMAELEQQDLFIPLPDEPKEKGKVWSNRNYGQDKKKQRKAAERHFLEQRIAQLEAYMTENNAPLPSGSWWKLHRRSERGFIHRGSKYWFPFLMVTIKSIRKFFLLSAMNSVHGVIDCFVLRPAAPKKNVFKAFRCPSNPLKLWAEQKRHIVNLENYPQCGHNFHWRLLALSPLPPNESSATDSSPKACGLTIRRDDLQRGIIVCKSSHRLAWFYSSTHQRIL